MKENKIVKLSEREHILKRPSMYIGSIKNEESEEYIFEDGKITLKKLSKTPGLLKIINEIIDNAIDEGIRTNFKFANKIDIEMEEEWFSVKDNGRGIPIHNITLPDGSEVLSPEVCWTHARAGSNFDENSQQIGANGVGSALTAIFSKKFIGETDDGKQVCRVACSNNNEKIACEIIGKSKKTGTFVKSYPDFEKLDEKSLSKTYREIIKTRLFFLSVSYPKIVFTFNGEKIQVKNKDFFSLFSDSEFVSIHTDKYSLGITVSDTDDFKQFTLMNGLYLKQGGSSVDYIVNNISSKIKDKLSKKFPSLKPADIKNKLFIISVLNGFTDAKYDSQTKEKLTNSQKEVSDYFEIDLESLANKVFKNKEILNSVTDYFKIKEEFKKRQELKSLEKTQKKIKSDKYTPPIGDPENLLICEGYSAVAGMLSCLGRKGNGFFELRGKPLNTYKEKSIAKNAELSELYKIIKNTIEIEKDGDSYKIVSGYKRIVIATDADLDGTHIASLLLCFFKQYCPEVLGQVYRLNTPIAISVKNKNIVDWVYDFDKIEDLSGEVKYMKGLGSWEKKSLDTVIKKDGFENMLLQYNYTPESDDESILDWFSDDKARNEVRKKKVQDSDFSLIKI